MQSTVHEVMMGQGRIEGGFLETPLDSKIFLK